MPTALTRCARTYAAALVLIAILFGAAPAAAQMTQDQMADLVLTGARKAYNEKNYPFAAARFREFLARFGGHKDAPSARYGLALSLLGSPERNYTEARDLLLSIVTVKDLPEQASALYHLGLAL